MTKLSLSSELIKAVALLTMTLDHITKIFGLPDIISDTLGRWSFPLFTFLIIQNFCHYHPIKKYVVRLGIFGVLTSLVLLPFHLEGYHNILYTFLWALIYIQSCEYVCEHVHDIVWQFYWLILWLLILMPLILMADYSVLGFLFILSVYTFYRAPGRLNTLGVLITGTGINFYGVIPALSSFIICALLLFLIHIRSEKRIMNWWFFYLYYPAHLLFLNWVYWLVSTSP